MLSLFNGFRFGRGRSEAPPLSQLGPPPSQMGASGSQGRGRRELLRVVLRDTLHRYGIPAAWFDAEVLVSTSRTGERGIHWRLVVKHADARLLTYAVSLQHALVKRLTTFDPLASAWLTGVSWQYALPEGSTCPALPNPGTWKEAAAQVLPPVEPELAGGASDVIAGPTASERAAQQARRPLARARADLDGLFAARDADFKGHAGGEDATQPMFLGTEPAKL
ncbi:MAG: hypothetical protein JWP43_3290 [Ramlibacter sp.]|nr:hypothetical protein [Ramlibacter sp.]